VTTPPAGDDDNPYIFDANQPAPRRKPSDGADWESTLPDQVMDAAAEAVVEKAGGCLLRGAFWLLKLPFRLALRIIENIGD